MLRGRAFVVRDMCHCWWLRLPPWPTAWIWACRWRERSDPIAHLCGCQLARLCRATDIDLCGRCHFGQHGRSAVAQMHCPQRIDQLPTGVSGLVSRIARGQAVVPRVSGLGSVQWASDHSGRRRVWRRVVTNAIASQTCSAIAANNTLLQVAVAPDFDLKTPG